MEPETITVHKSSKNKILQVALAEHLDIQAAQTRKSSRHKTNLFGSLFKADIARSLPKQ